MYDAIIVGARVAGAPTAMLLAQRGYKVLLLDKSSFPSDIMSTHYIQQHGVARLRRWGLLDRARWSAFARRVGPTNVEDPMRTRGGIVASGARDSVA